MYLHSNKANCHLKTCFTKTRRVFLWFSSFPASFLNVLRFFPGFWTERNSQGTVYENREDIWNELQEIERAVYFMFLQVHLRSIPSKLQFSHLKWNVMLFDLNDRSIRFPSHFFSLNQSVYISCFNPTMIDKDWVITFTSALASTSTNLRTQWTFLL